MILSRMRFAWPGDFKPRILRGCRVSENDGRRPKSGSRGAVCGSACCQCGRNGCGHAPDLATLAGEHTIAQRIGAATYDLLTDIPVDRARRGRARMPIAADW